MGEKERSKNNKMQSKAEEGNHEPEIKKPIDPKRVLQILEYRRKTMEFVESMLEANITIENLKVGEEFLCQGDYDGIVQERYLSKLCGWPICSNILTKEWNQKYHISMKHKKIYDVETRKLYCSVGCMDNSNNYRNKNLPEEPIWMRANENNTPNNDNNNSQDNDKKINNIVVKESTNKS